MQPLHLQLHEISNCLQLVLEVFVTIKSNFNYFGHWCDYVATIDNFILWAGWFFSLFSSMNTLICLTSDNSHQVSHTPRDILWLFMGKFLYTY
jgi:hypothetical protein